MMTANKKYFLILITLIFCSLFSYSQTNFEILIPWNDTSATGLYAKEMPDSTIILLSNNSYFNPDSTIFIEGVPTFGTGILRISPKGNIIWKMLYKTNGSGSWNIQETGRTPASSFFEWQNNILIPFSEYIGTFSCDSSGSNIVAYTYKTGTLQTEIINSNIFEKYVYLGDSLCSETTFQAVASINDSILIAIENDDRNHKSEVIVRTASNSLISKYEINNNFRMLNGNSRWGSSFNENVNYISSDTSFLTIVYDIIVNKEKFVKINSQAEVTELFSLDFPPNYNCVGLKLFDNSYYIMYDELDTTFNYNKNLNTHLFKYSIDGTIQEEITIKNIKPIDFEITQLGKILLLLDKSQGDIYDSITQPVRILLLDTNLIINFYRDFGFAYVGSSHIGITSSGNFIVTGTWFKDVPTNIKEPNQVYLLKSSFDSINISWTNIPKYGKGEIEFFKIYPNPNYGRMLLEYKLEADVNGYLEITDLTSRNLGKYSLSKGLNTLFIDKSELSEGIYFFRILTNNLQIKTEQIVILK